MDVTMTLQDELTTAAAKGNTAAVEALLERGAQVNGTNSFGRTALQVSAVSNSPLLPLSRVSSGEVTQSFQMANAGINPYYFYYFLQLLAIRDLYMSVIIIIIIKKERNDGSESDALCCVYGSRVFLLRKSNNPGSLWFIVKAVTASIVK